MHHPVALDRTAGFPAILVSAQELSTLNGSFHDYFSAQAAQYAAYRPAYPDALVRYLADLAPSSHFALDVGCGTGQLSVLLGSYFDRVVATDASAAQIEQAQPHERVEYRVASAEHSGLPDGSVNLITAAQAAHWLPLERFFAEVRRVAGPRAVVALITYGVLHVEGAADAVVKKFYYETLGPFWPVQRRHVEAGYQTLPFPFAEIATPPCFNMKVIWSLFELTGYLETWSAVREIGKALGRAPFEAFQAELRQAWGESEACRAVYWPLALRVGYV